MSLKKYMLIDLTILGLVGAIIEGVGAYSCFYSFAGHTPTTVVSLLTLFLAITRWNWCGLIIAPVLVFGNFIGALSIDSGDWEQYKMIFNFHYYLSNLLAISTMSFIVILFKRNGTNNVIKSTGLLVGVNIGVFILYEVVRNASYWIIGGRYLEIFNAGVFDLLALVILIVGCLIIRLQGSLSNVKDKILEANKERQERQKEHLITFEITDDDIDALRGVKASEKKE
jgi:hypothetical protein